MLHPPECDDEHVRINLAGSSPCRQGEARAIASAARRLDEGLTRAVDLILEHRRKVVVTGWENPQHSTPAVFLHAAEAGHSDLGIYAPGDPTLLVSKAGPPRNCSS